MTSLSFSQTLLLEKTQYKGFNAFVANEIVMDSIFNRYKDFDFLKIKYDSLQIDNSLKIDKIKSLNIQNSYLNLVKTDLESLNSNLELQLKNREEKHKTEVLYYKEKAKGKFNAFLYGTAIGGIVVALLTLM